MTSQQREELHSSGIRALKAGEDVTCDFSYQERDMFFRLMEKHCGRVGAYYEVRVIYAPGSGGVEFWADFKRIS